MDALFDAYPALKSKLPRVELAQLPTPVRRLSDLGAEVGCDRLFLKSEAESAPAYGGNKVRKLELLLGRALDQGRRQVITFGYAGSNHATATAVHARAVGLSSISMLLPQPTAAYLQRNLLISHAAGAELNHAPSVARLALATVGTMARHSVRNGKLPMIVAPGGSSAEGTVGFVAAAFELAAQVRAGELPLPDAVYVAAGSMGTAVGLALGFAAAGLPTRVVGVRVAAERYVNMAAANKLANETARHLNAADPSFPVSTSLDALTFRGEAYGPGYAHFTDAGNAAVELAAQTEALALEGTYTGKTLGLLIDDIRARKVPDTVLFWNTACDPRHASAPATASWRELPTPFHRYFTQ